MDSPSLHLAFLGHAHRAAVRCCCVLPDGLLLTGSLDSTVVVWQQQEAQEQQQQQQQPSAPSPPSSSSSSSSSCVGCMYTPHKTLQHHNDFVLCLSPSLSLSLQFYSGSKDQTLCRVHAQTGVVEMKYRGHKSPVCSVAEHNELVASGDWAGEARVWNRDEGLLLHVLTQHHSFAVCVCWMGAALVTGSQSRYLCVWNEEGKETLSVEGAHEDIIRCVAALPPSSSSSSSSNSSNSSSSSRLVSVSNDRRIKLWTTELKCLLDKEDAHEAFIFSDDGLCCLWQISDAANPSISLLQKLQHPATVWQAVELPTGDVATACEDGRLRIWTADQERALPADVIAAANAAAKDKRQGTKDGELVVCRRGDEAVVLSWQQQQQQWDFVGHALNPLTNRMGPPKGGPKTFFPGDQFFDEGSYDFVFNVELGEDGEYKKLPFNRGDNPLVSAEKFAAREGLHKSYLSQIVSFINANSGGPGGPSGAPAAAAAAPRPTGAAAAAPSTSNGSSSSSSSRQQKHIPVLQCVSFSKANVEGLKKGLLEAQQTLKQQGHQARLSELDESYLAAALEKLHSSNYLKENFRASEVHVMMQQLALFPASMQLPVFDLWRLFCLHPQYSLSFKNSTNSGWDFVSLALQRIKETCAAAAEQQQQQHGAGLVLCCLRYLANLLMLPTNRAVMLQHAQQVLAALKVAAASLSLFHSRPCRQALCCVLLNFAVSCHCLGSSSLSQDHKAQLCQLIMEVMQTETDPPLFYHLVVAAGTLLSDTQTRQQLRPLLQQLQQLLPPLNERVHPDVPLGEAAQEVLNLAGFGCMYTTVGMALQRHSGAD
ncbi:phospholipase A2 activating protein, putative [Eimeria tenella]|uniref:Phospholipase A2 activating protein, putative n=1 Tax=Eimeria tenella TaxID=5802 RepID=U6KXL0_EIMTE|nr:phospholipase A2 activating protein, putative [Eimeria tenella]CDJ42706.1 phospholipase A2 activating protein, putative [Eimeria tenella]|eukprot:XP_013233456.1 phospholipase A2 activating protein, putative [Eimeria tenella]